MKATMKPTPVPSPETWLSPSDFDEDIAKRVQQTAERLVGSGSVPNYLSDGDKKNFREAHHELVSPRKSNLLENIHLSLGCLTSFLIVLAVFSLMYGYTHDSIISVVSLPAFLVVLCIFAEIALAVWQKSTKQRNGFKSRDGLFVVKWVREKHAKRRLDRRAVGGHCATFARRQNDG